ncbi:MAG TPA: DUF2892 domain-containing protein [Mycobacterium sp.]|uniref:YgaP family membrane protein n=1 Tax=Mycolicibacterium sp. TaxID=2320850 RepID=UPI0025F33F4F|nr:DUF2892 domain-containing protein [Mycolicibacterium sp.]HPX36922.1 DUF2892 domain-containing protein [Mycobacterium sp.]HQC76996.1 DUF2892 domain-containing protein [Mycobacterium sp.]
MKKNMGTIDRGLRVALAALVLVLFLTHAISGTAAIILGAVAVVFLLTSFVGVCPAYMPLGISTIKK